MSEGNPICFYAQCFERIKVGDHSPRLIFFDTTKNDWKLDTDNRLFRLVAICVSCVHKCGLISPIATINSPDPILDGSVLVAKLPPERLPDIQKIL